MPQSNTNHRLQDEQATSHSESPDGYRISSSFYAGAMGISLPDRAANSAGTRRKPSAKRTNDGESAPSSEMQQLSLDLGD